MYSINEFKDFNLSELIKKFEEADKLNSESDRAGVDRDRVLECVYKAVKNKIREIPDSTDSFIKQVDKMSILWHLVAASMVKVKRTIRLPDFCMSYVSKDTTNYQSLNGDKPERKLCVSPLYGIKIIRVYHNFSIFNPKDHIEKIKAGFNPFSFKSDTLFNAKGSYCLDFISLQGVSQLDSDKIIKFTEITKDIVNMYSSWTEFYKTVDEQSLASLKELCDKTVYSVRYAFKEEMKNLVELDNLIAYKKKINKEFINQSKKFEPLVKKWEDLTKNFLVLSELKKTKLKV